MGRAEAETVQVAATVLRIVRAARGPLLALAEVEIEVAGFAFVLHGVRVIRTGPRSRGVAAPHCRVASGRLAAAISLPPELSRAIAEVVLDEYEALESRRWENRAPSGRERGAESALVGAGGSSVA